MPRTRLDEDGPRDRPLIDTDQDAVERYSGVTLPERTDPILRDLELDVRVQLRLDLRRLLVDGHVDPESGEPTSEELLALLHAILERHLRDQPFVVYARVTWLLDGESLAPRDW
jgi:hypothetical protein